MTAPAHRCAGWPRWRCRRWWCWPSSRRTCWSTPPSSATWAGCRSPGWPSAAACSPSRPGWARSSSYGTTARAARRFGAGQRAEADRRGRAGVLARARRSGCWSRWLAQVGAGPLTTAMAGGDAEVADAAATLAAGRRARGAGPAAGHRRQRLDARRAGHAPSRSTTCSAASLLSAVLCPLLVYPAGLGLVGSAIANAVAQTLGGAAVPAGAGAGAGAAASRPRGAARPARDGPRPAAARRRHAGVVPRATVGRGELRVGRGRRSPDRAAAVDVLRAGPGRGGDRRAVAGRRGTRRRPGRRRALAGPAGRAGRRRHRGGLRGRDRRRRRGAARPVHRRPAR